MQRLVVLSSETERYPLLAGWLGTSFALEQVADIAQARTLLRQDPPMIWLIFVEDALVGLDAFWHELRYAAERAPHLRLFVLAGRKPSWWPHVEEAGEEILPAVPTSSTVLRNALKELLYRGPSSSLQTSDAIEEDGRIGDTMQRFIGRRMGSALIEEEIGRGAMGAVFAARQVALERKVAVKVMLPALMGDDMAAQRFRREALAIARLKDNHIVQVFEAGFAEDGVFYIVMEYLEGGTIEDLLEQQGPRPIAEAVRLVKQVCKGLCTAHDAGLTHRDIKPSNLMISPEGRLTITDFGLVRDTSQIRQTKTNAILGTPAYLAPEQASSSEPDPRTDIYSLGIVLYELLTGELPFISDNLVEVLVMHLREPLPDPRRSRPEIPEALVRILQRMTEKNPNHRYKDSHALLAALEDLERNGLSVATAFPLAAAPRTPSPVGMGLSGTVSAAPSPSLWAQAAPLVSGAASQTGTAPMGGMNTTNSGLFASPTVGRPTPPPLESGLQQTLQQLKLMGMPEIDLEQPEGWGIFGAEGQVMQQVGALLEPWRGLGQSIFRHASTVAAHGLGAWWMASMQRLGQRLLLMPRPEGWGGVLLRREAGWGSASQSNSAMLSQSMMLDPAGVLLHLDAVDTVLVFDGSGTPLQQRSRRPQVVAPLQQLLHPLILGVASWPSECKELELWFEQSRIFVWRMRGEIWLLLGGVHLARAGILGIQQQMMQHFDSSASGSQSASLWAQPSLQPSTHLQLAQSGSISQSGAFAPSGAVSQAVPVHSGAWGDLSFQSLEPVANPLSQQVVEGVQQAFARYIGPMAKVALQKTAQKLGHSRKDFPSSKALRLLDSLANQLSEDKRAAFLKEARALLPPEALR
ncbi:protein kinase [Myxococcota bacterium]|nr:protein kinase [Myxococcota bacterium]